ncbi:MAG: ABC transporter ATP-binding protein [Ilumatobacteraceae bacterium]
MPAISTRDLTKHYGTLKAVDGLSFEVAEGEVYALLGHNGAGKSTTVEILEGHRSRTAGDVTVLGHDPGTAGRDFRDRIGIVLQTSGVEHELTVREAVGIYGSCYRTRRPVEEVVDLVGLTPQLGQRVGHLSGGQRRRLDLAMGIVGSPDLLFLDEPTTGFDPAARRQAWELIRQLSADGATVLLTTHYLDEAEHLADRVGVMVAGALVAEGTPEELIGRTGTTRVGFELPPDADPTDVGRLVSAPVGVADGHVEFTTLTPTADLHALTSWALDRGVELTALSVTRPSLEDVFLSLGAAPAAEVT